MSSFNAQPVIGGTSDVVNVTGQTRVADPFTASNMTWTELEDSTAEPWAGFYVGVGHVDFANRGILLIATGAASSETIIASMPTYNTASQAFFEFVPIPVAAGTRISAAVSTANGSNCRVQIIGLKESAVDSTPSFTVMESGPYDLEDDLATYGRGVLIDPGGTANTKGSYTEISVSGTNAANNVIQGDSVANAYEWLGVMVGDNFNGGQGNEGYLLDFATGAAAAETIFLADMYSRSDNSENSNCLIVWDPAGVSSGTRLSARSQSSDTDPVDRIRHVYLFGLR